MAQPDLQAAVSVGATEQIVPCAGNSHPQVSPPSKLERLRDVAAIRHIHSVGRELAQGATCRRPLPRGVVNGRACDVVWVRPADGQACHEVLARPQLAHNRASGEVFGRAVVAGLRDGLRLDQPAADSVIEVFPCLL